MRSFHCILLKQLTEPEIFKNSPVFFWYTLYSFSTDFGYDVDVQILILLSIMT